MRAYKYLPLPPPPGPLSSPPLLPPCVSFLCSKKGSMLSARVPLRDPLLLLHGGRLPRSTLSPRKLLQARLPLHAGQSPHVMTRPVKGWLVLWGWSGGAGDTWAIGPIPR